MEILARDFNSHSSRWGPRCTDDGNVYSTVQLIDDYVLRIENNRGGGGGVSTYHKGRSGCE